MRSALAAAAQRRGGRSRSSSLSAVPPAESSEDYSPELAAIAAAIVYRSPIPSLAGRPVYIINAAAFPDAFDIDYDSLLSYVIARLPSEDELLSGTEYEIIFFAGGQPDGATSGDKKQGPNIRWYLNAYNTLDRALRKKLQMLYIVHPRTWVRVLIGVFGTIVSPKFRRKISHVNSLSSLAEHIPIERLLIPPATYLHDRKISPVIDVPYVSGRRAFKARHPLPKNINTGETRLPRVLRETTSFLTMPSNIAMEGIFRVPPHTVLIGVLKEAYNRGQDFIVWKEPGATYTQPNMPKQMVREVRLEEAYGVFLAASLIKTWYRELREPIFQESSYAQLRETFGDPKVKVSPESLVDLILPASPSSPLTVANREILTRHLLPMLAEVAANESRNKMNSENLAILFSMVLVCGSSEMEDARIASTIKRILHAGIDMWPQLRDGLGLDEKAFERDLQPPADSRDYEDPLEDGSHSRALTSDESIEGHRIVMSDGGETGIIHASDEHRPALPPRPPPPRTSSRPRTSSKPHPSLSSAASMKRKPAPPVPIIPPQAQDSDPPRYSTVFDADGASINNVAESPSSYAPADGFGPQRNQSDQSEKDKKTTPSTPNFPDEHTLLNMPKRKAISTSEQDSPPAPDPVDITRSASEGTPMKARIAAQAVAAQMAQRMNSQSSTSTAQTPNTTPLPAPDDTVFRKPSLPASAMRNQQNQQNQTQTPLHSLAKPVIQRAQTAHTAPLLSHNMSAPPIPKPRTPSPGLLARMSSMETITRQVSEGSLGVRKLNLKQASVDDLRRLYEERASTVLGLERVDLGRRSSAVN